MSQADDDRHECERLTAMGRLVAEPICPRLEAIATAMEPGLWSAHVQEQIDYCAKNHLLSSHSHFGALFERRRTILRIRAMDAMRALERVGAGLPALAPFDPVGMSKDLGKQVFKFHRENDRLNYHDRVHVHHEPAKAVFFLKPASGIPSPVPHLARDGAVTLTWSEGDRSARLDLGTDGANLLTLTSATTACKTTLDIRPWIRSQAWRVLSEAADWVHHGGPFPQIEDPSRKAA